jgi:hypothetical protein
MGWSPIPSTSLQYVGVDVRATLAGVATDPTSDTVKMAFVAPAAIPNSGDWNSATWSTDSTGKTPIYTAFCLIGPGGTIALTAGTYAVFVKVTDAPEIPVLPVAGLLTIL